MREVHENCQSASPVEKFRTIALQMALLHAY